MPALTISAMASSADILAGERSLDRDAARDRAKSNRMLQQVRTEGFAERVGGIVPRTFSLAVPVHNNGAAVAAVNIICFSSAVSLEAAKDRFLPLMREAVGRIEAELAGFGEGAPASASWTRAAPVSTLG